MKGFTMKTSELQGAALDWAVAKADGLEFIVMNGGIFIPDHEGIDEPYQYRPSTDWAQGGPIIEQEDIDVFIRDEMWLAYSLLSVPQDFHGDTPLIAAMRCYVASQLGDEVSIPEGLV
jgi:hypothetical protein